MAAKKTKAESKSESKIESRAGKSTLAGAVQQAVTFEYYAPYADEVSIAGTFNQWSEKSHPMRREGSGRWRLTLDLPLGRHEYRYVVDGEWVNDQRAVEATPNPFGGFNNVARVS